MQSTFENNISIFQSEDGSISVQVLKHDQTLWLSLKQMAQLFDRDKSVISRHIKKIFAEKELDQKSVVAFFATTASDGKKYNVEYFNLDAIISVGYRVNSRQGTKFRQWATKVLNKYLLEGYAINESIAIKQIHDLKAMVSTMSKTLMHNNLVTSEGAEVLNLIERYSKTWETLIKYDEDKLDIQEKVKKTKLYKLNYKKVLNAIELLKAELINRNEASQLFGKLRSPKQLESIVIGLGQSFDKQYIYQSNESRAAHLLYFIIKDHTFVDGNKRIGCLLFTMFLNGYGYDLNLIDNNALVTISLLIAESPPSQKEIMIKLIKYLLFK